MPPSSFVGQSEVFLDVLKRADKIAGSSARVLIQGETGTGKELLARYIHDRGGRAGKPFIALNCAALPEALLESELFGHVKGAFTGALRTHDGLVSAARGGTLFLDEIAEISLPLQAKLLRFLETGEFRKVGSSATEKSDVRIIAATHRDLKTQSLHGNFREDLYYRLAVLTLALPPLRARKSDIPLLAKHFLEKFSAAENKNFTAIDDAALAQLQRHPWPGNIRELQNAIHTAIVMNEGSALAADMLPGAETAPNVVSLGPELKPLWQAEQEAIDAALRYCHGNIPKAAALLQVSPSTLYRRKI